MERRQHRLAFAAKRDDDEVAQIYVLESALGGEAQRITNAPTAASAPKWSPDGEDRLPGGDVARRDRRRIQSQGGAGTKERQVKGSRLRNFPDPQLRSLDRRIEDRTLDRRRRRRSRSRDRCLPGRSWRRCAGYNGDGLGAAWTPDGAIDRVRCRRQGGRWRARDGVVLDVAGAGRRRRTEATRRRRVGRQRAAFSPDGKTVCFSATDGKAAIYALSRLACAAWPMAGQSGPNPGEGSGSAGRSVGVHAR